MQKKLKIQGKSEETKENKVEKVHVKKKVIP